MHLSLTGLFCGLQYVHKTMLVYALPCVICTSLKSYSGSCTELTLPEHASSSISWLLNFSHLDFQGPIQWLSYTIQEQSPTGNIHLSTAIVTWRTVGLGSDYYFIYLFFGQKAVSVSSCILKALLLCMLLINLYNQWSYRNVFPSGLSSGNPWLPGKSSEFNFTHMCCSVANVNVNRLSSFIRGQW